MVSEPRRGEVWWVDVPDAGRRPALVLTRAAVTPHLSKLLVVPATTRVRGIPTEVPLDGRDGMPAACVLSLDNLTVARKSAFDFCITRLDPDRMAQVCAALQVATGCGSRAR